MGVQTNELQHIHAMEYYLAMKKTNINTGNSLDGSPKNYTEFKKKKKKSQSPKITYLQFWFYDILERTKVQK